MSKEIFFMKGNEALAEASIRANCKGYFGYPITPQSEVLEYLSEEGVKRGMVVLQAESEVASINMVYGASGAGFRVMTSSSSPGISLMQEGISYIASAELPCLIVNINRGGPGLGTIQPSQGDYFQSTKGGGHGDYKLIVLAPSTVQEMADFVFDGFYLAEKYRNPVMILADGALGQMMEKVSFTKTLEQNLFDKSSWTTTGKQNSRERNIITSLHIQPEKMEEVNLHLQKKYKTIEENEVQYELINSENMEYLFVAYGLSARISHRTIEIANENGFKCGLLRPKTLFPFPHKILEELSPKLKKIFVVEMNAGQMLEDVKLSVEGKCKVGFYGRMGGMIPSPEEVFEKFLEFQKQI